MSIPDDPQQAYELGYEEGASAELASLVAVLEDQYGVPDDLGVSGGIKWLARRFVCPRCGYDHCDSCGYVDPEDEA